MNKIFLLALCSLYFGTSRAQTQVYQNSIRFSIEDNVSPAENASANGRQQTPAVKYAAIYTHQLTNNRCVLEGSLGYTNYVKTEQFTPFDYYFKGDRSQRVSVDVAVLYNFLKQSRHALRFGGGLSGWYQRDGLINNLAGSLAADLQHLESISYTRIYQHSANLGFNVRGDYEFAVTQRIIIGARIGLIAGLLPSKAQGPLLSSLITGGLSLGYRLP